MSEGDKSKIFQVVNVLAIFVTIILNGIAEAIPVNGVTSKDVSDNYPSLFTPPGYVFSIWSVIYTLVIIFAIYQARPSQRGEPYLKWTAIFYALGGIINTVWLFLFHYAYAQPVLYALLPTLIFSFLGLLLFTYLKLEIGEKPVSLGMKLGVHLPISVYAGWVTLATIANTASVLNLVFSGIDLALQELLTAVVLIIALIITLLMIIRKRDFAFGLVVIWATVGIGTNSVVYPLIYYTALGIALIVAISFIIIPILMKKGLREFYHLNQ